MAPVSRIGQFPFPLGLVYGIIVLLTVIALLGGVAALAWPMIQGGAFEPSSIPWIIALATGFLFVFLVVGYISTMLGNFVVPLMHRNKVTATQAWKTFLALHASKTGSFVLFFLRTILISLGTAAAVFALVFGTCCIAVIPLIIPYLGTVILLPIHVFVRLLGPEFLRQFGGEFDTLVSNPTPPALQGGIASPSGP